MKIKYTEVFMTFQPLFLMIESVFENGNKCDCSIDYQARISLRLVLKKYLQISLEGLEEKMITQVENVRQTRDNHQYILT